MTDLSQSPSQNSDCGSKRQAHFFTREGLKVEVAGDQWVLPLFYRHSRIDFSRVDNEALKESIKRCVIDQASRVSTHSACQYWSDISAAIVSRQKQYSLCSGIYAAEFEERLIALMEEVINQARRERRLWALHRVIRWYIWCAVSHSMPGFSLGYAGELDSLEIPGNPKGEAVRQEDPECGPLHRALELQPIINALKQDQSDTYAHLQQKAAVALSIAFGRNPANLTFLRESDLVNLTPGAPEPCYILRMPRIKKRQLSPRDDVVDEYLEPEIAKHVCALIDASRGKRLSINVDGADIDVPKPLFISPMKNISAIESRSWGDAYNMRSTGIAKLIKAFVRRHNIISPLTGKLVNITPRRLRYTLATGLAAEGISKRELARILDHTDTQHVGVYFEMAGQIVKHLDKAAAKGFAGYLNVFKGKVIDGPGDAVNGARLDKHLIFVDELNPNDQSDIGICGKASICHLDPPYSCYLCPKFQPYRFADHEHVLECLLAGREERLKRYENARLGIQLDEVIAAVAQVIQICESESEHD